MNPFVDTFRWSGRALALGLAVGLAGCAPPQAKFAQNKLAARVAERDLAAGDPIFTRSRLEVEGDETSKTVVEHGIPSAVYQQISDILAALFGTPDEPHFFADANAGTDGFVNLDRLIRAAGPVSGDLYASDGGDAPLSKGAGLYRQHCVHCHGITGNGKGPTAQFLNPYPRDFTMGKFKFSSTLKGVPPTDEDLHRILMTGIDGTAMPSFALLDRGERDALIDYVKYLSVRGQTERALLLNATDLEANQSLGQTKEELVDVTLAEVVSRWKSAESVPVPAPNVPLFTEDRAGWSEEKSLALYDSIDRGRAMYFTAVANCFSCHGATQLGDAQLSNYDDWAKEYADWSTVKDEGGSRLKEHLRLGGLKPRIARPRNLRLSQYRGGRRPIDLFWRIHNGIDGSPMPNATLKPEGDSIAKGLTVDDIWDLVNFTLSLPYEKLSRPDVDLPTNGRIRS